MFQNLVPAGKLPDELATRCAIKIHALRLPARSRLRKCFTDDGDDGFYEGCNFDVVVRLQKRCVLEPKRACQR